MVGIRWIVFPDALVVQSALVPMSYDHSVLLNLLLVSLERLVLRGYEGGSHKLPWVLLLNWVQLGLNCRDIRWSSLRVRGWHYFLLRCRLCVAYAWEWIYRTVTKLLVIIIIVGLT